ncbi:MAG: hypothetical protein GY820_04655 [Gammaproteobacteria bacterium]|nr:hypothetical protein [Gammaproteobacteria bacterium]
MINWGKIYEYTWWGIGVNSNTISWGKSYEELAGFSELVQRFVLRVEADGGVVESENCVNNADFKNNNWDYYFRVIDDSGVVESLECINNI